MPLAIAAQRAAGNGPFNRGRSQPQQHHQSSVALHGGFSPATASSAARCGSTSLGPGQRSLPERDLQPASRGRRVTTSPKELVSCSTSIGTVSGDSRPESQQQSRRRWLTERQMELDRVRAELRSGSPQPVESPTRCGPGGGTSSSSNGLSNGAAADRNQLRESLRRARSPGSAVGGILTEGTSSSDLFQAVLLSPRRDRLTLATARQQRQRSHGMPVADGEDTDDGRDERELEARATSHGQGQLVTKPRLRSVDDPARSLARAREDAALRRLTQGGGPVPGARRQDLSSPILAPVRVESTAKLGAKPIADGGESSPRGPPVQQPQTLTATNTVSVASAAASASTSTAVQVAPAAAAVADVESTATQPAALAVAPSAAHIPPSAPESALRGGNQDEEDRTLRDAALRDAERVIRALQEQKERLMGAYEAAGGDIADCHAVLATVASEQEQASIIGSVDVSVGSGPEHSTKPVTPQAPSADPRVDPLGVSRRKAPTCSSKLNVPMVPLLSLQKRPVVTAQGVVLARPSPFRQEAAAADFERMKGFSPSLPSADRVRGGSPTVPKVDRVRGLSPTQPVVDRLRAHSPPGIAQRMRSGSPPLAVDRVRSVSPGGLTSGVTVGLQSAMQPTLSPPGTTMNSPRTLKADLSSVMTNAVPGVLHSVSMSAQPIGAVDLLSASTRSISQGYSCHQQPLHQSIPQTTVGVHRMIATRQPPTLVTSSSLGQVWQHSPRGAPAHHPPTRKQSLGVLVPDQSKTRAITSPRSVPSAGVIGGRPVTMMRPGVQLSGGSGGGTMTFSSLGVSPGFVGGRVNVPGQPAQSWQPAPTMARSPSHPAVDLVPPS